MRSVRRLSRLVDRDQRSTVDHDRQSRRRCHSIAIPIVRIVVAPNPTAATRVGRVIFTYSLRANPIDESFTLTQAAASAGATFRGTASVAPGAGPVPFQLSVPLWLWAGVGSKPEGRVRSR